MQAKEGEGATTLLGAYTIFETDCKTLTDVIQWTNCDI